MTTSARVARLAPRVLGLAVAGFLALFALDAFSDGLPLPHAIGYGAAHLIPAAMVLAVVVSAWRAPVIGAAGFPAAAAVYAWMTPRGHLDWIAVISGPLTIVGVLYFWSWRSTALATRRG
jgi:hypothetical protein